MITILVSGYAYIIWLFTGNNPLPHIDVSILFLAMLELMIEAVFIIFLALLIAKIEEVKNGR